MPPKRRGFTLVELIVSVTILTLVAGAVLACFQAGSRAWRKTRAHADVCQSARVVLRMMAQDLQGTFRSPHDGTSSFVGLDRQWNGLAADTVDFVAVQAGGARPGQACSDRCEIGYFIDNDPETAARELIRRIDRTPDDDDLEGGQFQEVGPFVKELNLEYSDGLLWYDEWGPDEGVPALVRIALTVELDGAEHAMAFSTVVYLPMAGFEYEDSFGTE